MPTKKRKQADEWGMAGFTYFPFEPAEKKNCDICGEPVVFTVDGVDVPATIRIAGEEF